MNDILINSNKLVYYFLNNKINAKIIITLLFISLIYFYINEPTNTIILLYYNKYYNIISLLLIFFISIHNPIIGFLLALNYSIIINKILSITLVIKSKYGGRKRKTTESEFHIKRDALSYFLT